MSTPADIKLSVSPGRWEASELDELEELLRAGGRPVRPIVLMWLAGILSAAAGAACDWRGLERGSIGWRDKRGLQLLRWLADTVQIGLEEKGTSEPDPGTKPQPSPECVYGAALKLVVKRGSASPAVLQAIAEMKVAMNLARLRLNQGGGSLDHASLVDEVARVLEAPASTSADDEQETGDDEQEADRSSSAELLAAVRAGQEEAAAAPEPPEQDLPRLPRNWGRW